MESTIPQIICKQDIIMKWGGDEDLYEYICERKHEFRMMHWDQNELKTVNSQYANKH